MLFSNKEGSVQNTMSQKDQRHKIQMIGLARISAKRNVGPGTFVTGIRLGYALSQMNEADNRYDNLNFIIDNQTIDSDLAFMPAYVMFGYQWSLKGMYKVSHLGE